MNLMMATDPWCMGLAMMGVAKEICNYICYRTTTHTYANILFAYSK